MYWGGGVQGRNVCLIKQEWFCRLSDRWTPATPSVNFPRGACAGGDYASGKGTDTGHGGARKFATRAVGAGQLLCVWNKCLRCVLRRRSCPHTRELLRTRRQLYANRAYKLCCACPARHKAVSRWRRRITQHEPEVLPWDCIRAVFEVSRCRRTDSGILRNRRRFDALSRFLSQ